MAARAGAKKGKSSKKTMTKAPSKKAKARVARAKKK